MTTTNPPGVTLALVDGIALVTIDDGKVNALSYQLIDEFNQALTDAERDGRAIVIAGRPGAFCAGFDLREVRKGMDRASAIIRHGGELIRRVFECPKPVVVAATGHAVAGGAVLLLVADVRIGADGPWTIGLNEVSIGLGLPEFVIKMGQYRLERTRCEPALLGELCNPASAVTTGYLDRMVPADRVIEEALEAARQLAARDPRAYAVTKADARAGLSDADWRPR